MARFRKVDVRIWNDAKFTSLSNHGKLIFLFLVTHPSLTMIGAMRATAPGLAAELAMPLEDFQRAFREALSKGMAKVDANACLIWLPNFLRYNKPESPNVVRAWPEAFDMLPECAMKGELFERLKDFVEGMSEAFREAFREAFPKDLAKRMPNQEQEQEQEQETTSRNKHGVDPRHARFKDLVAKYWTRHNSLGMPWDGAEAKQLSALLAANPALDEATFRSLLLSRHRSDVNHAERPRQWLTRVTDYGNGPLNQYNKPKGLPNDHGKGSAALRALTESFDEDQDCLDATRDFTRGHFGQGDIVPLLEAAVTGEH
jgi:hypothetical protein